MRHIKSFHAMTDLNEKNENRKYVITVGRQFGSGGREFARHIADAFGIAYYDKELLLEAACHAGVDAGFFERSDVHRRWILVQHGHQLHAMVHPFVNLRRVDLPRHV